MSVHNFEFSVITNIPGTYQCWSNNFLSEKKISREKMKMSKLFVGLFSVGFSNRISFSQPYVYQQPVILQPGYQQPIINTGYQQQLIPSTGYAWPDRNMGDNCDRTQVKSNNLSLFLYRYFYYGISSEILRKFSKINLSAKIRMSSRMQSIIEELRIANIKEN